MLRKTYAKVNLNQLAKNYNFFKKAKSSFNFLCPMVKANAYGHGDIEVCETLSSMGCEYFGVGLIEEALKLRSGGVQKPILHFGVFRKDGVQEIIENHITPVISNFSQLEDLKKISKPIDIHIKFDTGMHRLGFANTDLDQLESELASAKHLNIQGLCTHLWQGEDWLEKDSESHRQLEKFLKMSSRFSKSDTIHHIYNSAAAVRVLKNNSESAFGARPGIALYAGDSLWPEELKPILSLYSEIVKVVKVRKSEIVSYQGTWHAPYETMVGIIPMGYADGYSRLLSNSGEVLVRGERLKVVGTVCMDYFMVDLKPLIKDGQSNFEGETVVLIGEQKNQKILAEELASKIGTISYEIFTRLSTRVPRLYDQMTEAS